MPDYNNDFGYEGSGLYYLDLGAVFVKLRISEGELDAIRGASNIGRDILGLEVNV